MDKNIAFLIELVGGLFGILGIGYIFAGDISGGIIRLIVWFSIVGFAWVTIYILTMILIGCCMIPFMIIAQLGVPILSAYSLKKKLDEAFPE